MQRDQIARPPQVVQLLLGLAVLVIAVQELAANRIGGEKNTRFGKHHEVDPGHVEKILERDRQADAGTSVHGGPADGLDGEIEVGRHFGERVDRFGHPGRGLLGAAAEAVERCDAVPLAQLAQ